MGDKMEAIFIKAKSEVQSRLISCYTLDTLARRVRTMLRILIAC